MSDGRGASQRSSDARAPLERLRPLDLNEPDDERLDDELRFLRSLWRLDHALHSASKRMAKELGITGPQRFALRMLGRFETLSGAELAQLLELHPSTLTGMLDRLEKAGLLDRRAAPDDARRMVLTLSRKGRQHAELKPGTIEATVRRVLAGASPRDVQASRRLLNALADALDSASDRG